MFPRPVGRIPSLACIRAGWAMAVLSGLAILAGCGGADEWRDAAAEAFRADFLRFARDGDVDAMMGLYCWKNVSEAQQRVARVAIEFEIDLPIAAIELRPIQSNSEIQSHFPEPHLRPNIRPEMYFEVRYATVEQLGGSMLLGREQGGYRIIVGIPADVKDRPDQPKNSRNGYSGG